MSKRTKVKSEVEEVKFQSPIAQTVQATGNFVNNIQNPLFILVLLLMIGGGYLIFVATHVLSKSIENATDKIDDLSKLLVEQKMQNSEELRLLQIVIKNTEK